MGEYTSAIWRNLQPHRIAIEQVALGNRVLEKGHGDEGERR